MASIVRSFQSSIGENFAEMFAASLVLDMGRVLVSIPDASIKDVVHARSLSKVHRSLLSRKVAKRLKSNIKLGNEEHALMQAIVGMNLLENGYSVVFEQEFKRKATFYTGVGVAGIVKEKRREPRMDVVAWKRNDILGVEVKTHRSPLKKGEKEVSLNRLLSVLSMLRHMV